MTQAQSQAPQLPSPDVAFHNLFNAVRVRTFLNKMASFGFTPRDEAQATIWLQTAEKLRALEQIPAVKQAAASNDPFVLADQALDRMLNQYSGQQAQKIASDQEYMAIGQHFAQDPTLYASVLALKQAEAAEYQQQLAASKT